MPEKCKHELLRFTGDRIVQCVNCQTEWVYCSVANCEHRPVAKTDELEELREMWVRAFMRTEEEPFTAKVSVPKPTHLRVV